MKKTGRNDPCTCGSGKKYKHCCLSDKSSNPAHGAFKAIQWLESTHPEAVQEALYDGFFESLSEEELDRLFELDAQTIEFIMINAMEWVLADGTCFPEELEDEIPVAHLVLGPGGPLLTSEQRNWIEALCFYPIGLYEVVAINSGESMTLQDLIHPDLPPTQVAERLATQNLQRFDVLATRIMPLNGRFVLSGAIYPFNRQHASNILHAFAHEASGPEPMDAAEADEILSMIIREHWLHLYVAPFQMPQIIDHSTGEPLLFVTDHYKVLDWKRLKSVLEQQAEIEGDKIQGWSRLEKGTDDRLRPLVVLEPGPKKDRLRANYRTLSLAHQGKDWLENILLDCASFITREISDPEALIRESQQKKGRQNLDKGSLTETLAPDVLNQIIEERLHEIYRSWESQPIAALGNQTPLEAIQTAEGLREVKFLLRTYEHGEQKQAQAQGRPPISYAFLWKRLGLNHESP